MSIVCFIANYRDATAVVFVIAGGYTSYHTKYITAVPVLPVRAVRAPRDKEGVL